MEFEKKEWDRKWFYEDGIPLAGVLISPESVERLRHFDFKKGDVIVASYPKAGTTITQEITWLILHDGDVEGSKKDYLTVRSPFLEISRPPFKSVTSTDMQATYLDIFAKQTPPRHGKTHMPWQLGPGRAAELGAKIIYVMRDPKDVLVSNYYFARSFKDGTFEGTFDDFFEAYLSPKMEYGDIFEHYKGYWLNRDKDNILVVYYEELLTNHRDQVVKMAKFLGKELTKEVIDVIVDATTFKSMKENDMTNFSERVTSEKAFPFMRKGVAGDWLNHFNDEQTKRMNALISKKLAPIGILY